MFILDPGNFNWNRANFKHLIKRKGSGWGEGASFLELKVKRKLIIGGSGKSQSGIFGIAVKSYLSWRVMEEDEVFNQILVFRKNMKEIKTK